MNPRTFSGFTLVELLVVMAVTALIAGASITFLNPVGQISKGNDAKRKADIGKIQSALELYHSDNGQYPCCGTNYATWLTSTLVSGYIGKVPSDPKWGDACGGPNYGYIYSVPESGNGQTYTIFARLENTQDKDATSVKATPVDLSIGSSSDGYITFVLNGTQTICPAGTTYNYWVNNP
ncbi:MAG: prepilin-type N-terminal cleavage/methylation domain-containing protein [Candidatus Levybacteria bacterium]|nr:prepilin-type N-terminal cleavage/methylation domain-containing protein [Candidatus Levybacteria bacterium]